MQRARVVVLGGLCVCAFVCFRVYVFAGLPLGCVFGLLSVGVAVCGIIAYVRDVRLSLILVLESQEFCVDSKNSQ